MSGNNTPVNDLMVINLQENSDKIEVITSIYNQFHSYLRNDEDYEHKVSLAAIGLFIAFSAFTLPPKLGHLSHLKVWLISGVLLFITAVASWFLNENMKEMKSLCQRIVGFEKAMGIYRQDLYLRGETLLPEKYANWGTRNSGSYFNSLPYFVGVWFSAAIAGGSLWCNYYDLKTPGETHAASTPGISSFNFPDHLGSISLTISISLCTSLILPPLRKSLRRISN